MKHSPLWQADSGSAFQEILLLLWNPKAHYRVQNSPPQIPILSQMNPVHTFPPYFLKTASNVSCLHLRLRLPSSFLPSGFPTKILYAFYNLSHTCYMPRPSHLLDLIAMRSESPITSELSFVSVVCGPRLNVERLLAFEGRSYRTTECTSSPYSSKWNIFGASYLVHFTKYHRSD